MTSLTANLKQINEQQVRVQKISTVVSLILSIQFYHVIYIYVV